MNYILDEAGNPVEEPNILAWAKWVGENQNQKHLRKTFFNEQKIMVSTVFLGMNHAFDDGPPILWETMVFGIEEYCDRYRTKAEALEGHEKAVLWVMESLKKKNISGNPALEFQPLIGEK